MWCQGRNQLIFSEGEQQNDATITYVCENFGGAIARLPALWLRACVVFFFAHIPFVLNHAFSATPAESCNTAILSLENDHCQLQLANMRVK